MIRVERGGEYVGETYIWCDAHGGHGRYQVPSSATFDGASAAELAAFMTAHAACPGPGVPDGGQVS